MPGYVPAEDTFEDRMLDSSLDEQYNKVTDYRAVKTSIFNLYAFTYHDTYQKTATKDKSSATKTIDETKFKIPTLIL